MSATASPVEKLTSRTAMMPYLEERFSESAIQQRIGEMAETINSWYPDCRELVVVGVLNGSVLFLADLIRKLNVPCHVEFVRLASYGDRTSSSGEVKPVHLNLPSLNGKDVLIVEDIVDTGLTLQFLHNYLSQLHATRSLRTVTFLDKPSARTQSVPVDLSGFDVGNEFLVGYGLDYAGFFRELPFIALLKPTFFEA
ncbi:MAG: hypoxanthine phosphoribosyltransferase [Candidatus Melainabacteria bacterium]